MDAISFVIILLSLVGTIFNPPAWKLLHHTGPLLPLTKSKQPSIDNTQPSSPEAAPAENSHDVFQESTRATKAETVNRTPVSDGFQAPLIPNAVFVLAGAFHDRASLLGLLLPIYLDAWKGQANWKAVVSEIEWRFKFRSVEYGGEFYDHTGTTDWLYYIYYDGKSNGQVNQVVNTVTGWQVRGHVFIVKSGPRGHDVPEEISLSDLADSIMYYYNNAIECDGPADAEVKGEAAQLGDGVSTPDKQGASKQSSSKGGKKTKQAPPTQPAEGTAKDASQQQQGGANSMHTKATKPRQQATHSSSTQGYSKSADATASQASHPSHTAGKRAEPVHTHTHTHTHTHSISSGSPAQRPTEPAGSNPDAASVNAVRIRAGTFVDRKSLRALLEPWYLPSAEVVESNDERLRAEISRVFAFKSIRKSHHGRFYNREGDLTFWYHVYDDKQSSGPENEVASVSAGLPLYGDVVVVRHMIMGNEPTEPFSVEDLIDTILWYFDSALDPVAVAEERDRQAVLRVAAMYGWDV